MQHAVQSTMAALVATVVLTVLMWVWTTSGITPELYFPSMIAGAISSPEKSLLGWTLHIVIGVFGYGLTAAALVNRYPGNDPLIFGVFLGLAGWLIMMIFLMPMMGAGLFAADLELLVPLVVLKFHLLFGIVLGWMLEHRLARLRRNVIY